MSEKNKVKEFFKLGEVGNYFIRRNNGENRTKEKPINKKIVAKKNKSEE